MVQPFQLPDNYVPTYNYDWSGANVPAGATPYDQFDFSSYLQSRPDVATNVGYTGRGQYGPDYNLTPYDTIYAHYLGRDARDPSISVNDPGTYGSFSIPEDQIQSRRDAIARQTAIAPYLNEQGVIDPSLLGGQYTDASTIPPEVLAKRKEIRDKGFLGEWGSGRAQDFLANNYTGAVDVYGRPTIKGYQMDEYLAPSLKPGTEFTPTLISERPGQTLDASQYQLSPGALSPTATRAGFTGAAAPVATDAASYDATNVAITPEATMRGQLEDLMKGFEGGKVPAWAAPQIRSAQQMLAARGMGASSIAGAAVFQAAMEAATPIAQNDAAIHAQALFTNAAAQNAAKQFNAQSKQQNDQFFANLKATVDQFNADQKNAIERFNAGEANEMARFSATLTNMREQFNMNNRIQIDQANAVWRQNIDTINTATQNAANQFNAANLLNISNTSMNNLWQEWRDMADYTFTAGENEKARQHQIALFTMQNQAWFQRLDAQQQSAFSAGLGSLIGTVFGNTDFGDIFDFIGGGDRGTGSTDTGKGDSTFLAT